VGLDIRAELSLEILNRSFPQSMERSSHRDPICESTCIGTGLHPLKITISPVDFGTASGKSVLIISQGRRIRTLHVENLK